MMMFLALIGSLTLLLTAGWCVKTGLRMLVRSGKEPMLELMVNDPLVLKNALNAYAEELKKTAPQK